jgi:hypothetical protein
MGTYGPILWPPRSCDLTSMDFFFWAYIQDKVYITAPDTAEILRNRIITACMQRNAT